MCLKYISTNFILRTFCFFYVTLVHIYVLHSTYFSHIPTDSGKVFLRSLVNVRRSAILHIYVQFNVCLRTFFTFVYVVLYGFIYVLKIHIYELHSTYFSDVLLRAFFVSSTWLWYISTKFTTYELGPWKSPFRWPSLLLYVLFSHTLIVTTCCNCSIHGAEHTHTHTNCNFGIS